MVEPNRIPLNVRLEALLEALIEHYGINELLSALMVVCWDKATKATEEGQDHSKWSKLAVKLGAIIGPKP
jgi:hypothetical protein